MKYENITKAKFIKRPNRFIAEVELADRKTETVHVKNTGRCKELLLPEAEVWLTAPGTPGRKTKYDLVAVRKQNGLLINMDSQAPNKVVREWLEGQSFDVIKPEFTYGDSRVDFYMERHRQKDKCQTGSDDTHQPEGDAPPQAQETCQSQDLPHALEPSHAQDPYRALEPSQTLDPHLAQEFQTQKFLMEVKGCTLERDGIGYFPDAPTERGVKHIRELIRAQGEGYRAILAFVIQMDGITEVRPNIETHPEFGEAMDDARAAGVEILMLPCHVEADELRIIKD